MSTNSTSDFAQHDLDRERVVAALTELTAASTFNLTSLRVPENFNNLCVRLGYVLTDVIALTHVLLMVDEGVRSQTERLGDSKIPVEIRIQRHIAAANHELPAIDRLAVIYKAIFFSLRSLQDLAYAILLELSGQKAGSGTSMSKCFKSKGDNNPILLRIKTEIALYELWFTRFRDLRNELKTGRGHGLTSSNGQIKVGLSLQRGSSVEGIALIGLPDIVEAIEMSTSLFKLMKSICQSMQGKIDTGTRQPL